MLLRRMERGDLTARGFRSTFNDWCAEATNYPREVAEAALAHTFRDKTEAAYQRGDLMEKRRRLMAEWATFCARPTVAGEVLALRAGTGWHDVPLRVAAMISRTRSSCCLTRNPGYRTAHRAPFTSMRQLPGS